MKLIFSFFLLFVSLGVKAQDTVKLNIQNRKEIPFSRLPPHYYYLMSAYSADTIFYERYLAFDTIIKMAYFKTGIENLWVAFYKNGCIKEFGVFKKPRRRAANRAKDGVWLYFSDKGVLIEKKTHINEPFW